MRWSSEQMKPQMCLPGRHHPARLLYMSIDEPGVWNCTCTKCGHQWTEPA